MAIPSKEPAKLGSLGTPIDAIAKESSPGYDDGQLDAQGDDQAEEEAEVFNETQISKLLSERTTKIVIMIVLIMLFTQPIFQVKTYQELPTSSDKALVLLSNIYDTSSNWTDY